MEALLPLITGTISGLSAGQWLSLVGMIPNLIKAAQDAAPAAKEVAAAVAGVVGVIVGKIEQQGISHSEAADQVVTEGFAVPGWDDAETQRWIDNAVPGGGDSRFGG